MGTNYREVFDAKYWPALYAGYDTLAVLVKEIANYASVDGNGLLSGSFKISDVENALKKALEAEIQENAVAAANGESYAVDLDKLLPDANTQIVAAMYIRYYMGNSFFAHPNETGHKEIKNAVIDVINNPESEKDQALSDHLVKSVKEIHVLLCGAAGHTHTAGEPVWAEDYSSCSVTFTEVNGGWTVQAADGTYLALENKALVNTSAAFTWTYSNGRFSTTVETGSTGNNWWGNWIGNWWGSGSSTTYTATITVNAEGTEVQSVAYSTDGGNTWTAGTSFTSSSEITAFNIRVIGANGVTYYFAYNNGTVTQVG